MTLLDLQTMETPNDEPSGEATAPSQASLLLCGDSSLSVTTCS
ncbi:SapB/AmfS family lanthipeptide [Streptomyces sp. KR80]|jgi:hypothetical protein